MGHQFHQLAFTSGVKDAQEVNGSRRAYSNREQGELHHDVLGPDEVAFIAARDSMCMATVSETGWPYLQHRGGPVGFLRVLDPSTIGLSDFPGNRQYVSVGNLMNDERLSLFLLDYPNRSRPKILGRARIVDASDQDTMQKLVPESSQVRVERGILITVEAFDWNCPQQIAPRFTLTDFDTIVDPLRQRIAELKSLLAKRGDIRNGSN